MKNNKTNKRQNTTNKICSTHAAQLTYTNMVNNKKLINKNIYVKNVIFKKCNFQSPMHHNYKS
ncbi:MAG: hypothetical protein NZ928_06965 [Endomicrobia bacterium]|nr:hypothetical protein [Endomicrobiia bacterium]MDW8055757.1 hypothetical protein [Elusimicrobiota bacterium]